ncbi:hypothetical protein N9L02_03070, partial [Gammaproteobacteria bacterium]|nr:hypothetical protein [Gammaproteobacteria bacterium]
SFDATEERLKKYILENKKITVIGGSKTATDIILYLSYFGYKINWLYRTPYWFLNYDHLRNLFNIPIKKKLNVLVYKMLIILGYILASINMNKTQFYLWRLFNIVHTFGNKHSDYKKFHLGWLDSNQISELKRYNCSHGIQAEVNRLETEGIITSNKDFIKSDVIICCTGSAADCSDINVSVDGVIIEINKVQSMFLGMIIPDVPRLIFTAYHNFTLGTVNGILKGKWINKYIKSNYSDKFIHKNATNYLYPFFKNNLLFSSKYFFLSELSKRQEQFYKLKHISKRKFIKWLLFDFLFSPKSPKAFDFDDFKEK